MRNTNGRKLLAGGLILLGLIGGASNVLLGRRAGEKDQTGVAVIRGTVHSRQGAPLSGILIKARGEGKNYTTSVFTDEKGRYGFPALPSGAYKVWAGSAQQQFVQLGASGATQDFAVELGADFQEQTTGSSWFKVLPGAEAEKTRIAQNCSGCHSGLRLITRAPASADSWNQIVEKMMTIDEGGRPGSTADDPYRLRISPEDKKMVIEFLAANVKPEAREIYAAKAIVRPTGEAARAVFTEWDLPSKRSSLTSWTDPKGNIWYIAGGPEGPGLGRLDPSSGAVQEWHYQTGRRGGGGFHDLMGDERGDIWITGAGLDKILKFDPHTYQYTAWDIPRDVGTYPHTGAFDQDGKYWFTLYGGENSGVARLDPRTGEFTKFNVTTRFAGAYGLAVDRKTGDVWFTQLKADKISRVDRSGKVTEYQVPTPHSEPRRLQLDSKGKVWFTESTGSKLAMLDPLTGKISEYGTEVPNGYPYVIKVDKFDKIWFDDIQGNLFGRFDPETKKITLFLLPTPESFSRDISFDYSSDPYAIVYSPADVPVIGRMYLRK